MSWNVAHVFAKFLQILKYLVLRNTILHLKFQKIKNKKISRKKKALFCIFWEVSRNSDNSNQNCNQNCYRLREVRNFDRNSDYSNQTAIKTVTGWEKYAILSTVRIPEAHREWASRDGHRHREVRPFARLFLEKYPAGKPFRWRLWWMVEMRQSETRTTQWDLASRV